jgi:hypothetical protein
MVPLVDVMLVATTTTAADIVATATPLYDELRVKLPFELIEPVSLVVKPGFEIVSVPVTLSFWSMLSWIEPVCPLPVAVPDHVPWKFPPKKLLRPPQALSDSGIAASNANLRTAQGRTDMGA